MNILKNKSKKDEYYKKGNAFDNLKALAGDKPKLNSLNLYPKPSYLEKLSNSKSLDKIKLSKDKTVKWNQAVNDLYFLMKYANEFPNRSIKKSVLDVIGTSLTADEKKYLEEAEKRLEELKTKKKE